MSRHLLMNFSSHQWWSDMRKVHLVALCMTLGAPALSQSSKEAEAAFVSYADATKSYNTTLMTSFMHPDALKRFRTTIDAALRGPKGESAAVELLPLFSVATPDEFRTLSESEAYKRLNDAIAKSAPNLIEMMSSAQYELIGSLQRDGLVYVTYNLKMQVQGQAVSSQVVQTLKQHNGKWLLMLPSTADATIAGIEARYK